MLLKCFCSVAPRRSVPRRKWSFIHQLSPFDLGIILREEQRKRTKQSPFSNLNDPAPCVRTIAPVTLSALAQTGGVAFVNSQMMVATDSSFVENNASRVRAVSTKANDLAPFVPVDQSFFVALVQAGGAVFLINEGTFVATSSSFVKNSASGNTWVNQEVQRQCLQRNDPAPCVLDVFQSQSFGACAARRRSSLSP